MKNSSLNTMPNTFRRHKLSAALALVTAGALSTPSFAQGDQKLEEVIVTTERRALSIQDVAGTVKALDGDDLKVLGVNTDFKNLQNVVTGLHIANQEGKLEVFLRGIGSSDSDFASDPSVATHYNGIYLPRPRSIGPMFFDVERVEVNKGPQGTIRGRNATGGTINVISNRPDFDEYSAEFTLGGGKFDQQHYEAIFNLPVTDTLALRAAFFKEERDSYMTNAFEDTQNVEQLLEGRRAQAIRLTDAIGGNFEAPGSLDDEAIRISALYQPNDKFSAYVLADKVRQRGSSVPGAFAGRSLSMGYDIDDLDDPYDQFFINEGAMQNDIEGLAANLVYDFGRVALEYNASYREYDFRHKNAAREWQIGLNFPGARAEAEGTIFGNEQTAYGNFIQAELSETNVHEIRLVSSGEGPHTWSAGVFYLDEEFSNVSQDFSHGWWGDCDWYEEGTVCGWLNGLSAENRSNGSTVESTALFADGTFALTDNFRIKAGIRWTEDEKISRDSNANYQLIVTDEALDAVGIEGPLDIVMGTSGLALQPAGGRSNTIVPVGDSPTPEMFDFWVQGIQSFGNLDNVDELVQYGQQNPGAFRVQIVPDFLDAEGNPIGNVENSYTEKYVDWRLGFEYDTDSGSLVYGTISTGTRSGGINRQLPGVALADVTEWEPEQLLVYEVGLKTEFDVGGFPTRLNSAAFYYDYEDMVLQGLVSICDLALENANNNAADCNTNFIQNQNAAKAEIYGLEIDGDILLPNNFRLRANFAYLNSTLGDDSVILDTRQSGQAEVDVSGNRLPNTSEINLNFALSHSVDFDTGWLNSFDWTLSANYRSDFYLSVFNSQGFDENGNRIPLEQMAINSSSFITSSGFDPANGRFLSDEVPSSTIVNFNAGVNFGTNDQFRLEAWVSNLTEETFSTKAFINNSVNIRFLNTPRLYGLRLNAKF